MAAPGLVRTRWNRVFLPGISSGRSPPSCSASATGVCCCGLSAGVCPSGAGSAALGASPEPSSHQAPPPIARSTAAAAAAISGVRLPPARGFAGGSGGGGAMAVSPLAMAEAGRRGAAGAGRDRRQLDRHRLQAAEVGGRQGRGFGRRRVARSRRVLRRRQRTDLGGFQGARRQAVEGGDQRAGSGEALGRVLASNWRRMSW